MDPRPTVEVADGEIPEETAGPYPGDGSNGVNVLTESGIVRSDLTSSFGDASGVAEGVPVTVKLKVYDLDGEEVDGTGRSRRLPVALRPRRQLLDVRRGRRRRELPARRPGDRRRRARGVHHDLPGLLRRALAAHALRGLRVAGRRDDRTRTSCAPPSSRCPRTSATTSTPPTATRPVGHQPRRRHPSTATASSPTATRCSWPRSPARSTDGYTVSLNIPV